MNEHKISISELYSKVQSSPKGISSSDAQERLSKFGKNIISQKVEVPLIVKYLKNFTNFFALLLIFGAGLAFFAESVTPGQGNLYIGIALVVVVFLNATFTFVQEFQSEKIMEGFKNMMPHKIRVMRDGNEIEVPAEDVVPGDIIYLEEGAKIPADARLIEEHLLKVDHSMLTGESEPQLRSLDCTNDNILESRNMVFSGTLVQSGTGKALVYQTGMNTQIGKIAQLTKDTKKVLTPIRKELNYFIKIISSIAIGLGIIFFFISIALGKPFIGSLIFAIGIIVANVPEGLLPTVTLALSMASRRMAKKNALIKNLESVETLGSTTVICTDKTGTITQNRMFVHSVFINSQTLHEGEHFENVAGFEKFHQIATLCNNSKLDKEGNYIGDPTEGALLNFASHYNIKFENNRIDEVPFDSVYKRMITLNQIKDDKFLFMKGAPEVVLNDCNRILMNGKIEQFDNKQFIEKHYKELSSQGERVIALAYKEYSHKSNHSQKIDEDNYIFVGLAGLIDPPRPDIDKAISKCQEAGIKIIMITGDFSLTAEAIARKVGIIKGKANIMTGEELSRITDEELREFLQKDNVLFARTSPAQKLKIVQALQNNGEVVAVTGDGVNDAPALKNADIGISMGLMGTEVAKEASNMVLLDDNFATIVNAIEEGRTIYSNIKKFIAYILTSNVPEILPFIAFVLLSIPLPLTVVLILAIDLGTDLIPALGLGSEKAESNVMKQPPRSKKERLLTGKLLFVSYGIVGVMQAAAGFFSFFYVLMNGGWTWGMEMAFNDPLYLKAVTAFFISIVICQIPDVMICRTRTQSIFKHGFFTNKLVWIGIGTELLLLFIIVYWPPANTFFGTAPLTSKELLLSIPFAILIFIYGELQKYWTRKEVKFAMKYLNW